MWEQTRAKERVWLLPLWFLVGARERERKGGCVVSEHKEDRGRIVFFLEVSSMGIKQVQEREREKRKEKAWDKAEGSNFLQRTNAKKVQKNERGGVLEGIRESDIRGSCA